MVSLEGKISKKFPRKFLWGSATSAYQVEGGNKNSDWEHWKERAGRASDHYNRFEEDFDIAKSLHQNAHRFSVEWARIEPEKGRFDDKEIEHYRAVLKALKERKIKPLITLHHFTNPVWVAERGGWGNSDTISYFESYVRFVVTQLSGLCDFWITINEPTVYVYEGYIRGLWPPGIKDPVKAYLVARNLLKAHQGSYKIIHKIQPEAKVGIAYATSNLKSPVPFDPLNYLKKLFIKGAKWQDFIGINYYSTRGMTRNLPKSDMGWAVYPYGLYENLMSIKEEFDLPIYITENGIADADDDQRADFIADHLAATLYALNDRVDVRGYFYWSLLDNFEWAHGFGPRFGLIEIDYKTFKRKIRPSAQVYARIAKNNSL